MDSNRDVVRGVYQAFAIGDMPAALGALSPFAHVWKLEDGKAVSFHQYTDTVVHMQPLQA